MLIDVMHHDGMITCNIMMLCLGVILATACLACTALIVCGMSGSPRVDLRTDAWHRCCHLATSPAACGGNAVKHWPGRVAFENARAALHLERLIAAQSSSQAHASRHAPDLDLAGLTTKWCSLAVQLPSEATTSQQPSSCLLVLLQNWRYEGVGNKRRVGSSRTPGIIKDDAATAFVGNLPYSATEDDVIAHMSQVAKVVDARLPMSAEGACCDDSRFLRVAMSESRFYTLL